MKKRKERIDRGIKARSGDIFALSSWREMLYLAAPRLIPLTVFLVLPLILGTYWQKVLLSVAVFALLAISWDILAQTGMISLGQALFFGMGGLCLGDLESLSGLASVDRHSNRQCVGWTGLHRVSVTGTQAARDIFFHGYADHSANAGPHS